MLELYERWKKFVNDMNSRGIPMPTIRDPKTGLGSISLTILFFSFNIWVVSIVGKWSGHLGGIDPSQTLNMFMCSCALYFGRKMQRDDKGRITLDDAMEKKE